MLAKIGTMILKKNKQEMMSYVQNISRGEVYKHLIDNFCIQYYLTKPLLPVYRQHITRMRILAHNLNIEKGRYTEENRLCSFVTLPMFN